MYMSSTVIPSALVRVADSMIPVICVDLDVPRNGIEIRPTKFKDSVLISKLIVQVEGRFMIVTINTESESGKDSAVGRETEGGN